MWMKRFGLVLFTAILLTGVVTSCEEVEPTPENPGTENPNPETPTPEPLAKNAYAINDATYTFGSVGAMMEGENLLIVATPTSGVEGAEAIFECEEYFYGAVSPLLLDVEFDIMSEQRLFTMVSTLAGASLETVAPEFLDEVSAGKCLINKNGNIFTLKAELTLIDGTTLAVHIEAEEHFVVNENKIWRGKEEKPLRAAFYQTEGGTTGLYFTPGGIDYFEELEIATWYLYLVLDDELISGDVVSLSGLNGKSFIFGMMDNHSGENVEISTDDLQGATGSFRVLKGEEGHYTAEVNITIANTTYKIAYDGNCTWWEVAPEVKTNYMLYGKKEIALTSATIDTSAEVWVVELTAADGSVVTATAPANFFDGTAKGFSWSTDLTVSYLGEIYSKATGYGGTFTAAYDEAKGMLDLTFTNYSNLQVYYSNSCTRK